RLVAVKEMINQVADPIVRKSINDIYERESNILATLRHQSIPRIYDYFTIQARAYLVMEFVNGQDMDNVLAETSGFISEDQILAWAIELCDVLSYLHSQEPEPIVFRDMKPTNVMINLQNHITLVDFGIAKVFQSGTKNTMVGTQGYAPPDQYRGESTPAVDIYGLGATIHHLLTLRDPRLEAPFSFDERPVKEINPNASDEIVAVVEKSLEYNPEDRFESVEEMKAALMGVAKKTGALIGEVFASASVSSQTRGIKPLWTFECEDEIRGTPLYNNGTLYVGCYDNNLYALDASNGEFRWKYAAEGGLPGKPAIFDNNVYFGSEDNYLHVVSSLTGKVNWTYYSEGPMRSSPRIAQGHVFVGSDDGALHAVNSSTGRSAWKSETGSPGRSSPCVSVDFVYFGNEYGELFCVDFRGTIKWHFKAKRAITSSPVVHKDVVYFGSMDGTLYALDATSGWVIWRFRLGKGSISTPAIIDNLLFTGAVDKVIYGIDIKSSREVWRFITEHQVTGSPVIYKDSVYCGSVDNNLYCLEKKSGRLRWQFATEGPITGTPVTHEDVIYVGSTDKNLYALLA
ncbi:MAG: PQQ-binding-like beta-propeller repeat protein, partial [Chloroflexota bacterium]